MYIAKLAMMEKWYFYWNIYVQHIIHTNKILVGSRWKYYWQMTKKIFTVHIKCAIYYKCYMYVLNFILLSISLSVKSLLPIISFLVPVPYFHYIYHYVHLHKEKNNKKIFLCKKKSTISYKFIINCLLQLFDRC